MKKTILFFLILILSWTLIGCTRATHATFVNSKGETIYITNMNVAITVDTSESVLILWSPNKERKVPYSVLDNDQAINILQQYDFKQCSNPNNNFMISIEPLDNSNIIRWISPILEKNGEYTEWFYIEMETDNIFNEQWFNIRDDNGKIFNIIDENLSIKK